MQRVGFSGDGDLSTAALSCGNREPAVAFRDCCCAVWQGICKTLRPHCDTNSQE
jgi:hypothetical protein